MTILIWLIVVVVIVALLGLAFIGVQARRRHGGVIVAEPDLSTSADETGDPR